MILGIDTSAAQCAVALFRVSDPQADPISLCRAMERGHAEQLFPMIDAILAEAGTGYEALTRIGVCTGPGSFTGLRIGVAAARGIALGRAIPVIGVSRFEALAAEALAIRKGAPVAVCLSGRGEGVYVQVFGADGAALGPAAMVTAATLAAAIPPGVTRFAGDAAPLVPAPLLPDGLADPVLIARMCSAREPGALPAPLYLRGADAELPREGPPALLD